MKYVLNGLGVLLTITSFVLIVVLFFQNSNQKTQIAELQNQIKCLEDVDAEMKAFNDKEVAPYMTANRNAIQTVVAYGMKMRFDYFDILNRYRVNNGELGALQVKIQKVMQSEPIDSTNLLILLKQEDDLKKQIAKDSAYVFKK